MLSFLEKSAHQGFSAVISIQSKYENLMYWMFAWNSNMKQVLFCGVDFKYSKMYQDVN